MGVREEGRRGDGWMGEGGVRGCLGGKGKVSECD